VSKCNCPSQNPLLTTGIWTRNLWCRSLDLRPLDQPSRPWKIYGRRNISIYFVKKIIWPLSVSFEPTYDTHYYHIMHIKHYNYYKVIYYENQLYLSSILSTVKMLLLSSGSYQNNQHHSKEFTRQWPDLVRRLLNNVQQINWSVNRVQVWITCTEQ
jgi:hypothetical protein